MGNTTSFCDDKSTPQPEGAAVPEVAEGQALQPVQEPAGDVVVENASNEEEDSGSPPVKLWTAPTDRRFPCTNQARNCYTRYNEFYKCIKETGGDTESYEGPCAFYKKCYESLCPIEWIERWEDQRETGTWPGKY